MLESVGPLLTPPCPSQKVAGVRNRFQPLQKLPTAKMEIEALADSLFNQMQEREEADVRRLKGVASFISGSQCGWFRSSARNSALTRRINQATLSRSASTLETLLSPTAPVASAP